jgi:hypothetical protein
MNDNGNDNQDIHFSWGREAEDREARPMELLPYLFVAALVIAGISLAVHFSYSFSVRIVDGQPQVRRGKLTPAFLAELREACARHGVKSGSVRGLARGGRIALVFSHNIPPACRQQLRNWWAMSGWAAPRRA